MLIMSILTYLTNVHHKWKEAAAHKQMIIIMSVKS